jgi:hypothetical protein
VSVDYGPLAFSLKIREIVTPADSTKTAIPASAWQPGRDFRQWPSFEIHPGSPWNYGLLLPNENPETAIAVEKLDWPKSGYPFTPESVPIQLTVGAKKIPEWSGDHFGLPAELQQSPVASDQPVEQVTLIPMGAARLRISSFPSISTASNASHWIKPPEDKLSASYCCVTDTVTALNSDQDPASSNDHAIPRFTWWDHRGSREWVEDDFPVPRDVSSVAVYWFDDSPEGQCRLPKSWRLLYQEAGRWKTVPGTENLAAMKDRYDTVTFPKLKTSALRVEADLRDEFSAGILQWKIR